MRALSNAPFADSKIHDPEFDDYSFDSHLVRCEGRSRGCDLRTSSGRWCAIEGSNL
jgi:hypothetical protein